MSSEEFIKSVGVAGKDYLIYDINRLETGGVAPVARLPFCIKVLVENLLRKLDGATVTERDLLNVARWQKRYEKPVEIPFYPARVLAQDFTGVPAVVDLAGMRDAMQKLGGDPRRINPQVPVDLIVDHSLQVDYYGTAECQRLNVEKEYERNGERYALLKWAQQSFANFRVVPPRSGICHQVNLEYLSRVVVTERNDAALLAYPETLIGTDSHTTMINGIGVLGWGVGGIEAEAVMLGQPYYMAIPEVLGVKLTGRLPAGVTATELALFLTQALRGYGVVEKFVEYFGPGLQQLTLPERAILSNMAPEYGATMGFVPVDEQTLEYLQVTNRGARAAVVEACTRAMGLFYSGEQEPEYTDVLEIDLGDVEPAVAGPSRPYQRISLKNLKTGFGTALHTAADGTPDGRRLFPLELNGRPEQIGDGSVVLAAITSCTNTSNPGVLIGAGLMARNAVKKGLHTPGFVKTVLAPGSKVVSRYLENSGLAPYLEALGFHTAGFGCTVCIGNSGPLQPPIEELIQARELNVAAVISGNRNFEARIHPRVRSNFLASPILVVAFALAGRIDIDMNSEPLGLDPNGQPVFLSDIWPEDDEIKRLVETHVQPELFADEYRTIGDGDELWQNLQVESGLTFAWDERSSYIKAPPYFDGFRRAPEPALDITGARSLVRLGDSVTTDHISPAGSIPKNDPAGRYLQEAGVTPAQFNSFGSRRGNHQVMMRGTFGNIRLRNLMVVPKEGGWTEKMPERQVMTIYDAATAYESEGVPLIVLAGKEYGTGSSRDWAAKGTRLLGVKAVLAESFERIHRSNLVGMGVLPLTFSAGENCESLGLDGSEEFHIRGIETIAPRSTLQVTAVKADGSRREFEVTTRLDTAVEIATFQNGGILPYVLRRMLTE